jgi:Transposase DDE domain
MVSGLLLARRALDPPQRQLRQNQRDTPPPLRRQRLPNGLGRGAAHDAIQASARLRKAPCSPESATRRILSTYKRHLLWDIEEAFRNLKGDLAIRPIHHQGAERIEAHIFIAFLAYCLHVTIGLRLKGLAPGLTPRSLFEKFAAVQMIDVHIPTTDGRELRLTRYTQPEPELKLLLERLRLDLPPQPPPKITAAEAAQAQLL